MSSFYATTPFPVAAAEPSPPRLRQSISRTCPVAALQTRQSAESVVARMSHRRSRGSHHRSPAISLRQSRQHPVITVIVFQSTGTAVPPPVISLTIVHVHVCRLINSSFCQCQSAFVVISSLSSALPSLLGTDYPRWQLVARLPARRAVHLSFCNLAACSHGTLALHCTIIAPSELTYLIPSHIFCLSHHRVHTPTGTIAHTLLFPALSLPSCMYRANICSVAVVDNQLFHEPSNFFSCCPT